MVATWKPKEVEELAEQIKENNVVGLVDINGIPSKQFQQIRKNLSEDASIRVSKNVLMKRAFDKAGIEQIKDHVEGSVGLIFSDLDPFKLNKKLEKNRQSAPARAGDIAPHDIVVPKGDTPLPPGPVIGELQQAGVPAKIDAGKIVVQKDTTIVKEGEPISGEVAQILARLGIEPMEIGLDLKAAYESEIVYTQDILHIDPDQTLSKLQSAYSGAFNLSMNAGIFNAASIRTLLAKAFTDSMNLAINAEVMNKDTIEQFLSQANMQMLSLSSNLSEEALDDDLKEQVSSAAEQKKQEQQEQEEEDEEEEEEDDDGDDEEEDDDQAAAGMASMFG